MKKFGLFAFWLGGLCSIAACTADESATREEPSPSLAALLGSGSDAGFARATTSRTFAFPADHGPHPDYRNEWWYLTGNLDSEDGRRYGYEFTIFRFALRPGPVDGDSPWRTNQVYIGHFAVSDVSNERFFTEERFSRGAAGLAGAQSEPLRVWLYDWGLRQRAAAGPPDSWQVNAESDDFGIALTVTAVKPPVLQGDAGLSQKSDEAGNASYYYSLPRLETSGSLRLGSEQVAVSGLSWMDREWSSSALSARQEGWDWFALQLDDGTDLMFYQLRGIDGSIDAASAGSLVRQDGTAESLAAVDVEVEVTAWWDSPLGGRYPHGWHIRIPSRLIDLRVQPAMAAQELDTWVRYWEGAVDVSGTRGATAVSGRGYVELTGYAVNGPQPGEN